MKKTKERLIEIEEMYRALFERSFDAIYVHDLEGNFLDANPIALKLLGYKKKDIPSINFATLLIEEHMPVAIAALEEIIKTGSQKESNELQLRRKDGTIIWIETKAFLIYREKKPYAIQGIARDITDRKLEEAELARQHEMLEEIVRKRTAELTRANEILQDAIAKQEETQKALRESETRFREIAKNIPGVIFQFLLKRDGSYSFPYVSDFSRELYGFSPEEIEADAALVVNMFHEEDRERINRAIIESAKTLKHYDVEHRIVTPEGEIKWTHTVMMPHRLSKEETLWNGFIFETTEQRLAQQALEESERKYRELVENINDVIYSLNRDGVVTYVSPVVESLYGYSPSDIIGHNFAQFIYEDDRERVIEGVGRSLAGIFEEDSIEFRILTKSGEVRWLIASEVAIYDDSGNIIGTRGVMSDITDRKNAEEALEESERRYRSIFDNIQDVYYETSPDGIILEISPSVELISKYRREELIGKSLYEIYVQPEEREQLQESKRASDDRVSDYEIRLKDKDGSIRYCSINSRVMRDEDGENIKNLGSLRDITERKMMEKAIKDSLKEKEMLLMEVHHRVKNNMQIISSLLNLQSKYIRDKRDLDLFRNSQNRVRSMALVHEMLYKSEDLARIDFAKYIKELTYQLFRSYKVNFNSIKLTIDVEDIPLGVDTAIPCALIINEIVSNSLKYAFHEKKSGEIKIEFHKGKNQKHTLMVSDDGVGLPGKADISERESLGLSLVNTLTGQLRGDIKIDSNGGTKYTIEF
jgi:PAS domain S-box-containing protein